MSHGRRWFQETEKYFGALRDRSPFLVAAAEGRATADHAALFLANTKFLIEHTVPHLKLAAQVAEKRGLVDLAKDLRAEVAEEEGHEKWAAEDLARLGAAPKNASDRQVLPAMKELVSYVRERLEEHPALLLAYAFFVEALTVVGGPVLVGLLEEKCGVPRSAMSVVSNHVALDKHHVEEGIESLDELFAKSPELVPRADETIRGAMERYERFWAEIVAA